MKSPFVWIRDNTTSGQLPANSWENTTGVFSPGQPDCSINNSINGIAETCCHLPTPFGYLVNDVNCYYPQCPLCQLDAS